MITGQNFKDITPKPAIETYYIPGSSTTDNKRLFGRMPYVIEEDGSCENSDVDTIRAGEENPNNTTNLNALLIGKVFQNMYKYKVEFNPMMSGETTNNYAHLWYKITWKQTAYVAPTDY